MNFVSAVFGKNDMLSAIKVTWKHKRKMEQESNEN